MKAPTEPIVEPTVSILGSRVHLLSTARTVDHMESWIRLRDGECRQIVATGGNIAHLQEGDSCCSTAWR